MERCIGGGTGLWAKLHSILAQDWHEIFMSNVFMIYGNESLPRYITSPKNKCSQLLRPVTSCLEPLGNQLAGILMDD